MQAGAVSWLGAPEFALRHSRSIAIAASLFLTIFIGFFDYITGAQISLSAFYLIPVTIAAWFVGIRFALFIAAACVGVWVAGNVVGGDDEFSTPFLICWNAGIQYAPTSGSPTTIGAIDHVVATNNTGSGMGVAASSGFAAITISNSVTSNNGSSGIVSSGVATVTVDNDEISNNGTGLDVTSGTVVLSRSVINNNSTYGVSNSGTVDTLLDNRIYANGNNNAIQNTGLTTVAGK